MWGGFVSWSGEETDRLLFRGRVAAEQRDKSERAISIWSSTGEAVTAPACQGVCGELGQRSVGTTSRHPTGQRGETDGPSGDLLAPDRGCSVPVCARVCLRVRRFNRRGRVVLGDHLSVSGPSSLSCVVSSATLALPDTGGLCGELAYPSLMHFLLPFKMCKKVKVIVSFSE